MKKLKLTVNEKQLEYLQFLCDLDLKTRGLGALTSVVDMHNLLQNVEEVPQTKPFSGSDKTQNVEVLDVNEKNA